MSVITLDLTELDVMRAKWWRLERAGWRTWDEVYIAATDRADSD